MEIKQNIINNKEVTEETKKKQKSKDSYKQMTMKTQ